MILLFHHATPDRCYALSRSVWRYFALRWNTCLILWGNLFFQGCIRICYWFIEKNSSICIWFFVSVKLEFFQIVYSEVILEIHARGRAERFNSTWAFDWRFEHLSVIFLWTHPTAIHLFLIRIIRNFFLFNSSSSAW